MTLSFHKPGIKRGLALWTQDHLLFRTDAADCKFPDSGALASSHEAPKKIEGGQGLNPQNCLKFVFLNLNLAFRFLSLSSHVLPSLICLASHFFFLSFFGLFFPCLFRTTPVAYGGS